MNVMKPVRMTPNNTDLAYVGWKGLPTTKVAKTTNVSVIAMQTIRTTKMELELAIHRRRELTHEINGLMNTLQIKERAYAEAVALEDALTDQLEKEKIQ